MKIRTGMISILILIALVGIAAALTGSGGSSSSGSSSSTSSSTSSSSSVSASTTLSAENAMAQVYVSSVSVNPPSFYPYEDGTITIQLTNSGTQPVAFSQATILDDHIIVKNEDVNRGMIYIGPGNTMTYTFLVTAESQDGTYFPLFTVASRDAGSIRYPIRVDVDSTDIHTGISKKPDTFPLSSASTVNLSIVNSRSGAISNILVTPSGQGIDITPSEKFISSLPAGSNVEIPFTLTPHQQTNVTFHVTYQNGDNDHVIDTFLPVSLGEDKTGAKPIINNIALANEGSSYKLTGDVSNAGISDAKGLIITVGSPARPVQPYPEYAIGSLAADDFSSFELNFASTDLSGVPLVITWKDTDGNSFSSLETLDLRSVSGNGGSYAGSRSAGAGSTGSSGASQNSGASAYRGGAGGSIFGMGGGRGGGLASFYPVIAGAVLLVIAVVLWIKRKWIAKKLKRD